MSDEIFKNRKEAAGQLAEKLVGYKNDPNAIVIGLPRGGMVIAFEIAQALNLPLDFVILRKIGAPGNPELAIGAISEDGVKFFDQSIIRVEGTDRGYIKQKIKEEKKEIQRRVALYRADKSNIELRDKTAIIIDDGVATGITVRVAMQSVRKRGAKKVVLAVPVCSWDIFEVMQGQADEVICVNPSKDLFAIGLFYEEFPQVEDSEVLEIIKKFQVPGK